MLKISFSSMYDVNGNGHIDLQEMTQIVRSIYHLIGPEQVGFGFHFQEQFLALVSLDSTTFIFRRPNKYNRAQKSSRRLNSEYKKFDG